MEAEQAGGGFVATEFLESERKRQNSKPVNISNLTVTKRSGKKEPYVADKINRAVERACQGLSDIPNKVMRIISDFELTLYDGITTKEIDESLIIAASQNISQDPEYDTVARNLLLLTIYKDAIGEIEPDTDNIEELHKAYFPEYIKFAVGEELLSKSMLKKFDLKKLAETLDISRDRKFMYLGLSTLQDRYIIRNRDYKVIETPQAFWMRIAMGLSILEKKPTETAIRFYEHLSKLEYLHGTPTLFNSGTNHSQLSSCYIMNMYDEMEHIGKTVTDSLLLAKYAGGIGISVTNIRAVGSYIRSINGFSSGVIPFIKILDVAIKGVTQGGKRRGTMCLYMENWHYEFDEFMDLRQNSGDPYRRAYAAHLAAWISDEFMNRVDRDDDWYMFDPAEVKDLPELYGDTFSKRYNEYIKLAEEGKIKMFKKVKAREQFTDILVRLQTTSHPWITFKDSMNVRALTKNAGVIHSSNLCTEISLPNDKENTAVCNLASINLPEFLNAKRTDFDYDRLEKAIRSSIRALDNVIDINFYPIPETKNSNSQNRPIGLGMMGFTQATQRLGISYESPKAADLMDKVTEFISYIAIDESTELAKEKSPYPNFKGSEWSKGKVPFDTIDELEASRGQKIKVSRKTTMDWGKLRKKVKKGIRNADLMAIAPTATIGLIAGTSPSLDPNFANIFSRSTMSGKYMEFNPDLVEELKKIGIWEDVREQIIVNHGELGPIQEIPYELKELYKTSFEINAEAYTDVASRAQKWIDQAISRNMYLETRDLSKMIEIYLNAWKKGLKSTYYLHMKPRHTAEQSTVKVNKREALQKRGFAGFKFTEEVKVDVALDVNPETGDKNLVVSETIQEKLSAQYQNKDLNACPVDPAERENCESCQ